MKISATLLFAFLNIANAFNKNYVSSINAKNLSWDLNNNKFAEMKFEDFKQYNGYVYTLPEKSSTKHARLSNLPTDFDWRNQQILNYVKDQGQCGSCWAFSAIGALEAQLALKHQKEFILSEQEMVDCVKNQGRFIKCCNGCNGGEMSSVYEYLSGKEDELESSYPYTASDGTCKEKQSAVPFNVTDYVVLESGDEEGLMHSLYNIGPISIGVNANRDWQLYKSGIYDPTSTQCPNSVRDIDHGVVLIGYGEENGLKYWTIRNSWGNDWGEKGHIRIARGKNSCGVANSPIYPIVN
jgi:cathepsin L